MEGTGGDTSAVFLKQKWGQRVEPLNSSEKSICCCFLFFFHAGSGERPWLSLCRRYRKENWVEGQCSFCVSCERHHKYFPFAYSRPLFPKKAVSVRRQLPARGTGETGGGVKMCPLPYRQSWDEGDFHPGPVTQAEIDIVYSSFSSRRKIWCREQGLCWQEPKIHIWQHLTPGLQQFWGNIWELIGIHGSEWELTELDWNLPVRL